MAGYTYRGGSDEIDRHRWASLDLAQLALEQLAVCADTARQKRQEALERLGLTLQFRSDVTQHGGRDGLREAVLEVFGPQGGVTTNARTPQGSQADAA